MRAFSHAYLNDVTGLESKRRTKFLRSVPQSVAMQTAAFEVADYRARECFLNDHFVVELNRLAIAYACAVADLHSIDRLNLAEVEEKADGATLDLWLASTNLRAHCSELPEPSMCFVGTDLIPWSTTHQPFDRMTHRNADRLAAHLDGVVSEWLFPVRCVGFVPRGPRSDDVRLRYLGIASVYIRELLHERDACDFPLGDAACRELLNLRAALIYGKLVGQVDDRIRDVDIMQEPMIHQSIGLEPI